MTASDRSARRRSTFVDCGDEERLAAGAPEHGSNLRHAETVGVGLDHGGAFGGRRKLAQGAIIGGDRIEIDGEDGRLARPFVARARGDLARALGSHARRSGRRSSAARLPNRVNSGVNCRWTVPVGP